MKLENYIIRGTCMNTNDYKNKCSKINTYTYKHRTSSYMK